MRHSCETPTGYSSSVGSPSASPCVCRFFLGILSQLFGNASRALTMSNHSRLGLGESGCDAWTLARIAGHCNVSMSSRYVHPSEDAVLSAMARLGGHKIGHNGVPPGNGLSWRTDSLLERHQFFCLTATGWCDIVDPDWRAWEIVCPYGAVYDSHGINIGFVKIPREGILNSRPRRNIRNR